MKTITRLDNIIKCQFSHILPSHSKSSVTLTKRRSILLLSCHWQYSGYRDRNWLGVIALIDDFTKSFVFLVRIRSALKRTATSTSKASSTSSISDISAFSISLERTSAIETILFKIPLMDEQLGCQNGAAGCASDQIVRETSEFVVKYGILAQSSDCNTHPLT